MASGAASAGQLPLDVDLKTPVIRVIRTLILILRLRKDRDSPELFSFSQ